MVRDFLGCLERNFPGATRAYNGKAHYAWPRSRTRARPVSTTWGWNSPSCAGPTSPRPYRSAIQSGIGQNAAAEPDGDRRRMAAEERALPDT